MEDPLIIPCPYCDSTLSIPDNLWYITCEKCGKHLDIKSQCAFLRGTDAFEEGQKLFQEIHPKRRMRREFFMTGDREALELFRLAFSSLQVAFTAELAPAQKNLGVEMMCSMTQEFQKRLMVSPLEAQYWNTLMVEHTAQREYDRLTEKLAGPRSGIFSFLVRLRWILRQRQLTKSLEKLDKKIRSLEASMEIIDIPRARDLEWKPRSSSH